ncbi:NRPS [Myotisia sp. PD_48]|nr:NRPS [Myotisia sp. PD_48]
MQATNQSAAAYWEAHLAGAAPCHFPTLGAKVAGPKRPMTIKVNLEQSQQLKDLCELNLTTLPSTVRAAWALVLRYYTGAEDVCFGYQDSGSGVLGIGSKQGHGISGMPVARLAFEDESSIAQLVESATTEYTRSRAYYDNAPTESSLMALSGGHALFNTIVAVRTSTKGALPNPVAARPLNMVLPDDCRLRLLVKNINGAVNIFLEWWSSEMTMEQANSVASTVDKAITTILSNPNTAVGAVDLVTQNHLKQLLKWNNSPLQKIDRCIHEVIQDHALRKPDEEAICAWDGSFTFRELDHVTSRLAHGLVDMGVGPNVRVPLLFDKSKWTLVAMIAVMKAGGAFVPLDPSHPISRLQGLAKAVGASILLCSRHHAEILSPVAEQVVAVNDELINQMPKHPDPAKCTGRAKPSDAAYIIFTSGSTGAPKGTVLEHSAYVTGATFHSPAMLIFEDSRVLQFAAHTFDSSLAESLSPLMQGGCVCVPSEDARLNGIVSAINEMRVNHCILTPSFIGFIDPAEIPNVKTLVLAGEAMSQTHLDTWSTKLSLVNGYGPTEASVCSTANAKLNTESDCKRIGFPLGIHCWIVNPDDHDRLLPPGCVGELVLEGHTLAREYLNNPEKTAEAFICDPVWSRDGNGSAVRRFYKTGDLARQNLTDGSYTYVGRKDTQVKFHGQRIELGEIEHNLNLAPNVNHGLVLLPKKGHCKGRLVAVFSLPDEITTKLTPEATPLKLFDNQIKDQYLMEIQEHLSGSIPAYMVPSIWLCVESLPMLTSKKLDRKTAATWVDELDEQLYLQTHESHPSTIADELTTATPVETQLKEIWSRVLNIPVHKIGVDQSFLRLGGDSITAMTCMGQCKKLGLGLTVQEVLRSKSIKALALCVKTVTRTTELKEEVGQDFDLTPIQQYHFKVREEGKGHFNQSFFLRLSRKVDKNQLRRAIEAIVERHSMLRSRFSRSTQTSEWQQRVTNDIRGSYRFLSHNVDNKQQVDPAIANSQTSLNVFEGPLFAADLFEVKGGDQLLSMIGHHLVIDLVSWRVILEDLEEILLNPANPSLADKSIPFSSWSKLQKEQCQNLSLSDVMPTDNIPAADFDYWGVNIAANTYGGAACEGFEIDAATTAMLLTDCHSTLRTDPIDLLVAVLIHSFGHVFTDRDAPVIYNEGHGREPWDDSIDIARTVGWFTTVYPIFVENSSSCTLTDITRRVKDIRRRVPGNGRSYFARRWLTETGRKAFDHHAPMELSFNYLGQYQQLERSGALLQPVDEMAGEAREAGGTADFGITTPRFGLFEISAVVVQGKLRFSFTFNRHMKHQATIKQWISRCQQSLKAAPRELVGVPPVPTLSDFPMLDLNYDSLQSMITEKLPLVGAESFDDVEDAYPCSPMQQGLLLSRSKDNASYAVHATYEVVPRGGISVSSLQLAAAWKLIVRRHPALRTIFLEGLSSDGLFDQVVLKKIGVEPTILRCNTQSEVLSTFEQQGLMQYQNYKPANQFTICETANGKVYCRVELSHAVMDGSSMSIIFRDLGLAYSGKIKDESGPLFSGYVSYLKNLPFEEGLSFWTSYLKGTEPCHFPVLNDGVTPPKELRTLRLEFKELAALQSFCDSKGFTIPNAIHTAWSLTLRSYVGTEDTCFGYLSSGRDAPVPGINDAVGPFINMLACRVNIPNDVPLVEILDRVQKDYMDSLPHKHTSLAEVQHALKLSDTPLFNTCVSYRRLPTGRKEEVSQVAFEEFAPIHDPDEYPISINIEASDEKVAIDLDYWTDSISSGQANNIANSFIRSLENITYNSHVQVGKLDILSSKDYEQIWSWNSKIPETIFSCVHDEITKQMKSRPRAQAICGWDGSFTYSELDTLSTRLAEYLVALGVTPETFVPTCFDKSAYTVISMLAVLKAGGACVPLDANHPRAALEMRVMDTEAQIVVASAERAAIFEDMVPYVVAVNADLLNELPNYGEISNPAQPGNPAFVIFTSGSTGKPKGVVLEHSAMVTSAEAHGSALGVGPDTRFLQFATYTFDNSLEEMFTTLQRGGCVCVPSEDDRFNDLPGAINRLNANFMDLTPTVATFLKPADVPKIKGMAIGGEAMTKKAQEIWGAAIPMHNQYGPSECSINATHNGETGTIEDISNIGRSVGSVSWIADPVDHNKLVPVGCVGELLIEGPIVARGYLNDAEKTKKSFIENPAWAEKDPSIRSSARRMYKTGDLVRYDSNGSLVYLGRKDTQVKLNGQRIELGEIEHHVKENLPENIQSAVQLVAIGGIKALAAFLCLQSNDSGANENAEEIIIAMSPEIRAQAKQLEDSISKVLPGFMVPSIYIPVSTMPLTSSGKLDRRTLVTSAQSLSDAEASAYRLAGVGGRAPSTEAEKILQLLWADLLSKSVDSIGADDSFFRHGGDSVGAMKLVPAARAKGLTLSVAKIFQCPKLCDLAASCSLNVNASGQAPPKQQLKAFELLPPNTDIETLVDEVSNICQIDPNLVQDIYPCTSMQGGLVALSSKTPGAYVAQSTFRLPADIDFNRFRNAWQLAANAEVVLRTRIVFTDLLGFLQVVVQEPLEWESAATLQDIGDENRHIPESDGGILAKYTIVGEGTRNPHFIWTAHHALYDGWSIPTLLERVAAYYRDPAATIKVEVSFPEFMKHLSTVNPEESDKYWKQKLEDPIATPFPSLLSPSYKVQATSKISRTAEVARSGSRETTLASIIRAAWAITLSFYTNSDDVIFGEILTGRDAPVPGIEDMIGPSLTSIPTRVRLDRDATVGELLAEMQKQLVESMPYQFAGLAHIKRLGEDASVACEFQNAIAITQDADETANGFWDMLSSGTTGNNFYTYPLNLSFTLGQSKIDMDAYYDNNLISSWQVEKLLVQFEGILSRLTSGQNAQQRVGEIELVSSEEANELEKMNKEGVKFVNRCLPDIIQEQARADPQAEAVASWDTSFTYQELEDHATALAHHLVDLGVGSNPEVFVPICFEKSSMAVIAILAILKAGGAFVPIDAATPISRLQEIVDDVNASVILCSPKYEDLCESIAPQSLPIDLDMLRQLPQRTSRLPIVPPTNAAYIIFTSGSTGKPKGCLIEHAAFASSSAAHAPKLGIIPKSRVLQFGSYSFDSCCVEILTTLMAGGCVCIPSEMERMNEIQDCMNRMKVDTAILTPSFAKLLNPDEVPHLKTLSLVGEAMSPAHVSTWASRLTLVNGYGPSECSVSAIINSKMTKDTNQTNMGYPLDKCWIVDPRNHDRLVPIGAVGELVIEGATLARGYLNNREKTNQVFINNPKWATRKGSNDRRMYKTGDLVRYSGDGSMEFIFIGRKDSQAKIRGQRLELDEVEVHLMADDSIRHALICIPTKGATQKKLVAAVTLRDLQPSDTAAELEIINSSESVSKVSQIRERLSRRLPTYMIPTKWIVFQKFPLMVSGKLDRRQILRFIENMKIDPQSHPVSTSVTPTSITSPIQAESVPAPAAARRPMAKKVVPAVDIDLPEHLRKVWSQILNLPIEDVDLNSSFLQLGGDSISAMQVMARCRSQGITVTVQNIMQSKSILELVSRVKIPENLAIRAEEQKQPMEDEKPFDLSPIQKAYLDNVGDSWRQFNQSLLLRLTKRKNQDVISKALEELIKAHPMLRARFNRTKSGEWRQRVASDISGSLRFRSHNDVRRAQLGSIIEESQKSIDIENGPIVAVDLFNLPGLEINISIAIHHLVIDVVSWRIILQDFEDILNGVSLKNQDTLTFQSWCQLQKENAQQETASTVLPMVDIPTANYSYWGMSERSNVYGDVVTKEFQLDQRTTGRLLDACRTYLQTDPVDVLLAVLLLSFRQQFTERPVTPAVYNEGHGREPWDPNVDPSLIVGWFTTMSPVCLPSDVDISDEIVFADTIRWVQEFRSRTPGKGRPYFAYRSLTEDGSQTLKNHWPIEIAFNYLGQMQDSDQSNSLLVPVDGPGGQSVNSLSDIGSDVPRFALIEISAVIVNGELQLSFGYNKHMNRCRSICDWASRTQTLLENATQTLEQQGLISKSFPLLPLTFGGLRKIAENLSDMGLESLDEVEDVYVTSSMQQGILISQLKDPRKYAFNSIFEVQQSGKNHRINIRQLEAAWQRVVARHSSLRSVFVESISGQGLMDQIVLGKFHARTLLLESTPENVDNVLSDLEPLNYADKQPPHRLTICQSSQGRVVCKIEMSHAISDGTSMAVLINDLSEAYGSTAELDSAMPYSDFIAHLQSTPKAIGIDYWKTYLSGIEPCTLPSLAEIPTPSKRELGNHVLKLNLGSQLQEFCKREGLTPANVLQLVWGLVLRCYIGSDDICFGYVSSGRDLPVTGIQEAVGAFINMLVCRLSLKNDDVLTDALHKAQSDYMQGIGHQNCSLAEVQHELGLGDTSLFNTVFTFQKRSGSDQTEDTALDFKFLSADDPNEFNISVNVAAIDSLLEIDFDYWSDTVSNSQAINIAQTFEHVLNDILVHGSDRVIGEIDFFSRDSCRQVRSWNAANPTVINKCVHEVIEQQALLRPRTTLAICGWDATLTYSELDTLAARLASQLVDLGVGPDVYVPICFEKSAWTIVAQLGILKAGGAFVCLDPAHPATRLSALIEDVGAEVVLCSPLYYDKVRKISKSVFLLDPKTIRQLPKQPLTPPSTTPHPSNAAYIIFTSGTTGKPKGTVIEHASICTGAAAHGKALLMENTSRVLQFASYTFDASITEILTALMVGATVCVPSDEDRMNGLQAAISKAKCDWALLTPSVLSTLSPGKVPTLKTIVTGGEAMSEKTIKEWIGGPAVVNAYGPTEASVVASASLKVDRNGTSVDQNRSNIGSPTGCRAWVVDPRNYNRLMPVGAVGELLVEGRTVARGYLNNPQKTAEVFVQSPDFTADSRLRGLFSQRHRMYRTGDLVRYNHDGTINYISRKDNQVKINGQRIELGEIEYNCKLNLPNQTQSAVDLLVPSDRAKKTLAVFFTVSSHSQHDTLTKKDGSSADELLLPMNDDIRSIAKALETGLSATIPSYMVPHLFIPVSKLPWSASGKLDRNRLRNMVQELSKESIKTYRLTGIAGKRAISSDIESKLQTLWERVLGLPKGSVAASDSFFRLGGDSLAAMQLAGVSRTSGISLTFANIFKHPILADMARTCQVVKGAIQQTIKPFSLLPETDKLDQIKTEVCNLCRVDESSIANIYPCSSLQEGLIALSLKQPGAYVAQNVFKLSPHVDIEKFKSAWELVVHDLEMLRTRIVHTATSNFLQVVLSKDSIVWETSDHLDELAALTTTVPPYNGGTLTKYTVVNDKYAKCRYFVWSIHHALYDGWSLPLILDRVSAIYAERNPTPPKSSYAEFIHYLSSINHNESDQFWRSNLAGYSSTNFPQVPASTTKGSQTKTISHCVEITKKSPTSNVTIPTVIRAAWALVIAGHTLSDDVCFGETLTGRNIDVPHITEIVGPTLTTIPTRIQINRQSTVDGFLKEVQQNAIDLVRHQHVGIQYIRRLDGEASAACDFQNLLVIQTTGDEAHQGLWQLQESGDAGNFFTYPLVLECRVGPKEVEIVVYHKEDIISSWEIQRIMSQFGFIFKQLYHSTPDIKLAQVEILSPEDKDIISRWNRRRPHVVDECIHDTFIRKADSQPDAPALCDSELEMTYEEVKEHATQFAHYLNGHGVGPEMLVPVCLDKSAWTVVAILGVLMAGAAFVPLDPSHPVSRHHEIVDETEAKLVICSPAYVQRFSSVAEHVVKLDTRTIPNLPQIHTPLPNRVKPNNSAYAIFTSGSTGRAKGIVIEHRAFNSCSATFGPAMLMYPDSRVLQFASLSFDAAVMEILTTLTTGGCVCVPSEDERLKDIPGAILRMNVTWTLLTPSVANIVDPDAVPCLETLVCGGEAMSPEVISKWADKVRLVNAYGPSESSVVAAVNPKVSLERNPSCIGHGVQATLTWVLDPSDHHKLAPLGAAGELALEGPTLARGYLKNPQKTAEGFIETPGWAQQFPSSQTSRRIHKTGDLVKYNRNGSLEFVGRKDNQVKLNGQRMELGEIEHRLDTNPSVRHVLVLMPKSGLCKKKLVAVVSPSELVSESSLSATSFVLIQGEALLTKARACLADIRNNLADQLPPFMVPQVWAMVKSIPLLASGKLDRKQAMAWVENLDDNTYKNIMGFTEDEDDSIQSTPTIKLLQEIWAVVLNLPIEKVKLNRSFMSLGGDSISAMAVMSRCRKEKINLSLHDVLRSKSLVHLASCVTNELAVPTHEESINEDFDLSPIQQLYFQSSRTHGGRTRFNQSFSLRVAKEIQPQKLKLALEAIINQHSMLRTRFSQNSNGIWKQKVTEDIANSYCYRIHQVNGLYTIPPFIEDTQMSLNIETGPILAADFFNVRGDGQYIFLVAHHLCVDMVSWRIILQELQEYLETGSLSLGKPLPFRAWCSLQRERTLRQNPAGLIPFKVEPSNLHYWGMEGKRVTYQDVEYQSFQLNKTVTKIALGESHKALQTEPIDLFISSLAHSFKRVFNDRSVPIIFNEGHGREPWQGGPDLSRTVAANGKDDVLDTLRRTKDIRRKIPDNGRPYFSHQFSNTSGSSNANLPMEIVFNYLGRMQQLERDDSLLQQADLIQSEEDTETTADVGPNMARFALFEISAIVLQDQLQFNFMFDRRMKHTQAIRRWISECKRTVEETAQCMSRSSDEPTLSDYPLLPITYEGLKKLVKVTFPKAGVTHRDQVEDIYPCSPMQEGILLSQARDPESYLFNTIFKVEATAPQPPVDAQKLGRAWQSVVDRHAALRTVFVDSLSRGVTFDQVVVKEVDSGVVYVTAGDSNAVDKLNDIKLRGINAKRSPKLPHQLSICTTSSGTVMVKMEINHAVIDGGSVAVLVRDLIAAYENQLPTGPGPLYSDYIKYIRTQPTDKEDEFWRHYLNGLRPSYLPRLNAQVNTRKTLLSTHVKFNRYSHLQELCERNRVTLANAIHAAWAFVLRSYTGSDDVCFGYLSAGRDAPVDGIQDAIGAFINMLCCRVKFLPSNSFQDVFQKVQTDYLDSLPYQRCSLAKIQHDLGLAGKPLYNTAVSIQNHSKSSDAVKENIVFEPLSGHDPSEYAVTVNVETARNDEGILLRYWSDVVSESEAQKLASLMADTLARFVDNPGQLVTDNGLSKSSGDSEYLPRAYQRTRSRGNSTSSVLMRGQSQVPQVMDKNTNPLQLTDNHAEFRKLVDTCVQEILQKMAKSGNFSVQNADDISSTVEKNTSHIIQQRRESMENKEIRGGSFEDDKPSTIHAHTVSSESYEDFVGDTKKDVDSNSIAPSQFHRRGRSHHLQKKLLSLWGLMLEMDVDGISAEDSFFELGGDSLTAMKLVGAARDEGLTITVADVFRNPVFEDMVAIIQIASMMSTYIDDREISDIKAHTEAIRSVATSELYQRFALVKTTQNIDTFLQSNICPKVGVFKGGIADVLPVTDFQALAITGSLLESRWMLNYFFLDGTGTLDLRRLKRSFIRLVHSVDILRTVFLPCGDRFLQVVLRKMRPDFFVYETESTLDEFTEMLRERDREQGPHLGEAFVNFTVVKEKDSDHHRIIIRLSHAQYDGVCLPKIFSAIQTGYEDEPLPPMSSFASYVRASAATVKSDHYQHWRTLLKGSRMTEIVRREGPNYRRSAGATSQLKQSVLLPSIAHGNITTATIIKAAWAMVLAELSGNPDVVFGHTISGRNATVAGIESTVGPCLNIIPVRVQFGEFWTALDLLRYVQDQQVTNMAYEALGFREITKHCTEWPDWTNFTTVVQHLNVSRDSEIMLGDNMYKVGAVGTDEDFADFSVISRPLGSDKCEIALGFSLNGAITPIFAQKVLNMLCNTISNFMADPSMSLLSPLQVSKLSPQTIDETREPSDSYFHSSQLQSLSRAEMLVLSDIVSRAWKQVLGDENTSDLNLDSSFFELNGDIMGLAQVAWLLEQEGLKVRVEDLIDHPTMLGQMATICSQEPPGKEQNVGACSSLTSIEEDFDAHTPLRKQEKNSWLKAMGMARRMVRRNTNNPRPGPA